LFIIKITITIRSIIQGHHVTSETRPNQNGENLKSPVNQKILNIAFHTFQNMSSVCHLTKS